MWPNSRVDRRAASGTRRKYREAGAWVTRAAGLQKGHCENWRTVHLLITFRPPDQRKRDLDNMLAAIKSGLDGVADALGADDSRFEITIRRGDPDRERGGCVEIELGPQIAATNWVQFKGQIT
jgi:crossover junction endodeoxyribonuclease RusA